MNLTNAIWTLLFCWPLLLCGLFIPIAAEPSAGWLVAGFVVFFGQLIAAQKMGALQVNLRRSR